MTYRIIYTPNKRHIPIITISHSEKDFVSTVKKIINNKGVIKKIRAYDSCGRYIEESAEWIQ